MRENFFGDTASDVFDRIKHVLGVSTSKELAHIIQMSESGISSSIKRNSIPYAFCAEFAMGTGVPLDWLIFGDVDGDRNYREVQIDYFGRAYQRVTFVDNNEQVVIPDFSNNQTNCKFIPLYDVPVSAGHGSFFDAENIIQQIPFDVKWLEREELIADQLACLPIKGDSMSPGLKTSDIVLVDLTHQRGDGVFVLRLNGALRIKRLQWLADGRLRISSDNPIYETEYVDPNTPPDDFAIIGFCHTKIGRVD
nr:MAG TPA: Repressor protein CI [Caudoviricetes sp.]